MCAHEECGCSVIGRYLIDTQVLVRWLHEPRRLSREQDGTIRAAQRRGESFAVCAVTLLEIATVFGKGSTRTTVPAEILLSQLDSPQIDILPITIAIASEVASIGEFLRDPADRAIVATARVHGLTLITSDQRIISSKLVPVIE
jgi:PIN domain nuclease of toxin-antitoxin system